MPGAVARGHNWRAIAARPDSGDRHRRRGSCDGGASDEAAPVQEHVLGSDLGRRNIGWLLNEHSLPDYLGYAKQACADAPLPILDADMQEKLHAARFWYQFVPTRRTSLTFRARFCSVNGFCRNAVPGPSAPWWRIVSSVYPER